MQIISTINSFVQLQGTSYNKKKNNFTFCPGKSRENSINIFQDFPGLTNKIQGLSRTFQDSKKNPGLSRTFPGCGNPEGKQHIKKQRIDQRRLYFTASLCLIFSIKTIMFTWMLNNSGHRKFFLVQLLRVEAENAKFYVDVHWVNAETSNKVTFFCIVLYMPTIRGL